MSSDDSIQVYFRIVGLYFGSVPGPTTSANPTGDVSVQVSPNPTVREITREVERQAQRGNIKNVKAFGFKSTKKGGGSEADAEKPRLLSQVGAAYTVPPRQGYAPGPYILNQHLHSDPQQAFQYYIYDVEPRGGGDPPALRLKNTDNTFVPFNRQPEQQITDGDFVVWRLANIARGPTNKGETRLEQRLMGDLSATDDAADD